MPQTIKPPKTTKNSKKPNKTNNHNNPNNHNPNTPNPFITLKNLTKFYTTGDKTFKALDDIDLELPKGEFIVILGPSGVGKSTLLNLLGGMDQPTHGHIIVGGENISQYSPTKLAHYRAESVGFIFQFYNILPTLTALENVALIKNIVKHPQDPKKALRAVGLEHHYHKFPSQLSGGEQQRVSIARAIAKKPQLLLCDEPTGALDSQTGVQILKLLHQQCASQNTTVIIVTHNSLIADVADRVVRLKNGKIASVETHPYPKNIDEVIW